MLNRRALWPGTAAPCGHCSSTRCLPTCGFSHPSLFLDLTASLHCFDSFFLCCCGVFVLFLQKHLSRWLLAHKAFPFPFPWLEQHPRRAGRSRGGHCALWWQSSDDRVTSGAQGPVRLAQRADRFVPEGPLRPLRRQSLAWPSACEPFAGRRSRGDPSGVCINRSGTRQAAVSGNSRSEWPLRHCKRDSSTRYFHALSVSQGKSLGSCFWITAGECKELLNKKWI